MKKITVVIVPKASEPGLLGIVDGRVKSLVPFFDGTRIIDYYTAPLASSGFNTIVLVEKGLMGMKNHLSHSSGSGRMKVLEEAFARGRFEKLLNTGRNEALFLLRADDVILTEWEKLFQHLLGLPQTNIAVMTEKRELIGFFIQKPVHLDTGGDSVDDETPGLDRLWDRCSKILLDSSSRVIFRDATCYSMKTAFEYYTAHQSLLKNVREYLGVCSAIPSDEHGEDYLSSIAPGGFLFHSHVSHSCIIEGYVENSILFSGVRVGRGARVIDSIVMDNNYIGEGSCIQRAIICDCGELFPKLSPNIGERSRIGEAGDKGRNRLYPEYLHGGITMIGRNVEVPKDYRIPGNCYIVSGTDRTSLKSRGRMRDGDSLV